jgi:folate-binding protein YgfZ
MAEASVIDIGGKDRVAFLQGQSTNDIVKLPEGESCRAASLNPKGHLLAEFRVKKLPDRLRILTEKDRQASLLAHLRKYAVFQDVSFQESVGDWQMFDFAGAISPRPSGIEIDVWPAYFEWAESWLIRREEAGAARDALPRDVRALTPEEAEVARIESGRPLWGRDMDESNLPDEVGMDDAISTTKGCYVGQEIVARLRTYGRVTRRLAGLEFEGGFVPPRGSVLLRHGAPDVAGEVTSTALSVRFGAIGLGFVRRDVDEAEFLELRDHPGRRARVAPKAHR